MADATDEEKDILWSVNLVIAKMRHDVGTLRRNTWITAKSISALENQIWIYLAKINNYNIF